jgi:hypothetical protein
VTQAGWYPDPAGQPQTYRYWDGSSWSEVTTSNPYAPPPGPPPWPPAPPAYGPVTPPPPYGGYQGVPAGGPGGPGVGTTIALVVLAVLLVIGLGVGGFFGVRALTDDDDTAAGGDGASETATTGTDEPTEATSEPTEDSTDGTEPTTQQCHGGVPAPSVEPPNDATRISGGGLSIPVPPGYDVEVPYSVAFTFADDFTPSQKVIEQTKTSGWVSIYGVGALRKANGFETPEQAAEVVMSCMAASPELYSDFSGRTDLSDGEVTVGGRDGYQVSAELRVDDPAITVEGDVAQVIVVDTGDEDTFGLYISVVPIGDQALIAEQEAMVERIRVE